MKDWLTSDVPEAARWRGPPNVLTIRMILSLTRVDSEGHRYFRTTFDGGWKRLRTVSDFAELNAAVKGKRHGL